MADAAGLAEPKAGLIANGVAVPLDGVSVEAQVTPFTARVTMSQRYTNRETQPVEAVYVFPVDEGAAVCGFEAVVAGVHYVGEVLEREAAFARYDSAMEEGHGAYLLDEERPDVFVASLGNIPPGGHVLLRLTYVTEVPLEGGALRFTVPTTVSPRYAPSEDRSGVGRPDAETLNPPVAWSVPYGLDLTVTVDLPVPITRIESVSHPARVMLHGTKATVTLASEKAALDRDFVLLVAPSGADEPAVILERDGEGRLAALLAFRPQFDVEQSAADVIFVIDRSGSMSGSSIEQVRNALQMALRSLSAGCRFNIVGFGSTYQALFPDLRDYCDESLKAASEHVASLDADLGGTEILPALEFALRTGSAGERPRQVVVLTDGEVTNTDAVIALARSAADSARIFTFGIGYGASHHLVRGLARAGGGTAEFIYPGERVEQKVMRQLSRLLSPALTDVGLDWGGLKVRQAPSRVPPVFARTPLKVYGLLDEVRAAEVTLSAETPSGPVSARLTVDPSAVREGSTIGTLAARALIRELEEGPEWIPARGSRQSARKQTQASHEIIRLATAYKLASRETSFVAVEHRESPVEGDVVLRRVPVALTTGWGGVDRILPAASSVVACRIMRHLAADAFGYRDGDDALEGDSDAYGMAALSGPAPEMLQRACSHEPASRWPGSFRSHRLLDVLVSLQQADGSWDLTSELAAVLGRPLEELEAHLASTGLSDENLEETRRVWATALAVAWLETVWVANPDEWRLLARKGHEWLDHAAVRRGDAVDWRDAAFRFLRS